MLTKDISAQGRKRTGSFEQPMLPKEYVKEVRKIEEEEVKNLEFFVLRKAPKILKD